MNTTRPRWTPQTKLAVSLIVLAFFIYLVFRFSIVIPPLILAIILASILSPVVSRLQLRLHTSRLLGTALAYLVLIILLFTIPALLVPPLAAQMADLNLDVKLLAQEIQRLLGHQFLVFGQLIDGRLLIDQLGASLRGLAEPFIGQTLIFLVDVITSVVWVIFILVVSFYLVKDGPALRRWLEGLPPPEYRQDYIRLRDQISLIWGSFFRGQVVLALVVALIFTIVGFVLGLPFALAMGILAGLLEFLPSIGHGIWLTIAALLAAFIGSTWLPLPHWAFATIVIGLHLFYQQFDLNYLIPRIIGHSVHLPPLVVILGIVAGAVLAGILGIPLAAPTIASTRVIGRYLFANLFDLDPFPSEALQPVAPPNLRWWRPKRKGKQEI